MRAEIMRLRDEVKTTFIYVTHDQVEAMSLGDRMVVMEDGVAQQVGTPNDIYKNPANAFVASFIGSPQMNLIRGRLYCRNGLWYQRIGRTTYRMEGGPLKDTPEYDGIEKDVIIGIRPGELMIENGDVQLECTYDYIETLGDETHPHFRFMEYELTVRTNSEKMTHRLKDLQSGDMVAVGFDTKKAHYFDAESERQLDESTL